MRALQWKANIVMFVVIGLLAGSGEETSAQDRSAPAGTSVQKTSYEQTVSSAFDWLEKLPPPVNRKASEVLEKIREIEEERRKILTDFATKALDLRRELEDAFSRSLRKAIQTELRESIKESSLIEYRNGSIGTRSGGPAGAVDGGESNSVSSELVEDKLDELDDLVKDSLYDLETDYDSLVRELSSLVKRTLPKPGSDLYHEVEKGLIAYYHQRGFSINTMSSYIDELVRKSAGSLDRESLEKIITGLNLNISQEEEDLFEFRYDFEHEIKKWWLTSLSVLDEERLAGRLALLHDALSSVLAETAVAVRRVHASILRQSRALESLYDHYPVAWHLVTIPVFINPARLKYNERQELAEFIEAASLLDAKQIPEMGLYYPEFDEIIHHFCLLTDLLGRKGLYRFLKEIGIHSITIEAAYANLYALLNRVYFSKVNIAERSEDERGRIRSEELIDKLRKSFDDGRQSQVERRWAILQLLSDTESQVFFLREAENELLTKLKVYLSDLYRSVEEKLEEKLLSTYAWADFKQSKITAPEDAQLSGVVVTEHPDLSPFPLDRVISIEGIFFDENGESFSLPLSYEKAAEYYYSAFTEESQSRNSDNALDEDAFLTMWGYIHGQIVIPSVEENNFQPLLQKMVFPQLANAQEIEDPVLAESLRTRAFLSFLRIYRKQIIPSLTKLNVQPKLLQTDRFHTVISLIETLDENGLPLDAMYDALGKLYVSSFSVSRGKDYKFVEAYLANRILSSFSRLMDSYTSGPLKLKKLLKSESLLRNSQDFLQRIQYLNVLEATDINRSLTHYLEELDYFQRKGLIDEWFSIVYSDYIVAKGLLRLSAIKQDDALSWLEDIRLKGLIEPEKAQIFAENLEAISTGVRE